MSDALRQEMLEKAGQGELLDAIFTQYGKMHFPPGDPVVETLAGLHNDGMVDLLALATPEALAPFENFAFFKGQHLYCALIPHLQTDAESLVRAVNALIGKAGSDGAAGFPAVEFRQWCEADPKRPFELLDLVDRKVPDADRFLPIALRTGAAVDPAALLDRALDFAVTGEEVEKRGAVMALRDMPLATDAEWDRLLEAFSKILDASPSDNVRFNLLTAIAERLESPTTRKAELVALAKRVLEVRTDVTLGGAVSAIAFSKGTLPDAFLEVLLEALGDIPSANAKILDYAMMKMVERGQADRARAFLEGLLKREDSIDLEVLDALCYKIRELGGSVLEDWTVAWLLDGDADLCGALNDAIFGRGIHETIVAPDFSRFGLKDADRPYLARKIIVTFLLNAELIVAMLAGLLRSSSGAAADEIVELLFDPVLLNYSGVAADELKKIADDTGDPASGFAQQALDKLDAYLNRLRSIGDVAELHPSDRERQIEQQRHADAMAEAYRNARKDSLLSLIATESVMLYGTSSVSWFRDGSSPPKRNEMALTSIGHSFEVPRVDTIDPVGLQRMLVEFRREVRPS